MALQPRGISPAPASPANPGAGGTTASHPQLAALAPPSQQPTPALTAAAPAAAAPQPPTATSPLAPALLADANPFRLLA